MDSKVISLFKSKFLILFIAFGCLFTALYIHYQKKELILPDKPLVPSLEILGEIPKEQILLNSLLSLSKEDFINKNNENNISLSKVHSAWLNKIVDSAKQLKETGKINKNFSHDHPIPYFSTQSAKYLLKPVIKNIYDIDLTDNDIDTLFSQSPRYYKEDKSDSKYNIYRDNKIKLQIYNAAKDLFEISKGKTVVSIGHTPTLLCEMLRGISDNAKESDKVEIINVPFSGRPDLFAKHRPKHTWKKTFRNIITPNGEKNYREFLSSLGFSPKSLKNKQVVLIDDSRGDSLASFLLFTSKWYQSEGIELNHFEYAAMGPKKALNRINRSTKSNNVWEDNHALLEVNEDLKFKISVNYLNIKPNTLRYFLGMKEDVRIIPSMNGINWEENLSGIMKNYPVPKGKKLLRKYYNFANGKYYVETKKNRNI